MAGVDVRISELPAATAGHPDDRFETTQVDGATLVSRSITLDQVVTAVAGSDQLQEVVDDAVAAAPPAAPTGPAIATWPFLPLTGGTLTGALTGTTTAMSGQISSGSHIITTGGFMQVDRAGDGAGSVFYMQADAGQADQITFRTGTSDRWIIAKNGTAEGGSNAGSDFQIIARNDAAGALSTPLTITRSTGAVTLTGALTGTIGNFTTSALVGYGTAVPFQSFGSSFTPLMQVAAAGSSSLSVQRYTASATSPVINLSKSAGTTNGAQVIVSSTENLGTLSFNGSDGTQFVEGAYIRAVVDGTPGVNDMPTRLIFATSADGTATPTEAMRITSANYVGVDTSGAPLAKLHVKGVGQSSPSVDTSTTTGAAIFVQDTTTGVAGSGGMVMFGAGAGAFASVKAHVLSNTPNTSGDLVISTRRANADATLTETARFLNTGATTLAGALSGTTATFSGTVSAPGAQLQMVSTQTGAVATGTTLIPTDNTIPQQTEGDQYMTLAITPKSATSKLIIEIVASAGTSSAGNNNIIAALFQDAAANALATAWATVAGAQVTTLSFCHVMTSGTTSSTTFKVRLGQQFVGTLTFNGTGGTGYFGGTLASSIVIREVAP